MPSSQPLRTTLAGSSLSSSASWAIFRTSLATYFATASMSICCSSVGVKDSISTPTHLVANPTNSALQRRQKRIGDALGNFVSIQAAIGPIPHADPVIRAQERLRKDANVHGSEVARR